MWGILHVQGPWISGRNSWRRSRRAFSPSVSCQCAQPGVPTRSATFAEDRFPGPTPSSGSATRWGWISRSLQPPSCPARTPRPPRSGPPNSPGTASCPSTNGPTRQRRATSGGRRSRAGRQRPRTCPTNKLSTCGCPTTPWPRRKFGRATTVLFPRWPRSKLTSGCGSEHGQVGRRSSGCCGSHLTDSIWAPGTLTRTTIRHPRLPIGSARTSSSAASSSRRTASSQPHRRSSSPTPTGAPVHSRTSGDRHSSALRLRQWLNQLDKVVSVVGKLEKELKLLGVMGEISDFHARQVLRALDRNLDDAVKRMRSSVIANRSDTSGGTSRP